MGKKLTAEQRADLERQLAEDDETDDDGDECEVGFGDGSYMKGSFRRVSEAAAARGLKLRPDPKPDAQQGGSGQGGGNLKRFNAGRRTG